MANESKQRPAHADDHELFLRLFTQNEGRLRAYVRSLVPTWDGVDEVMQEASLVMWRKFDQFDPDTLFIKWATVISRFEALKYRRTKARDRHVFNEDIFQMLAAEADDDDEELFRREKKALATCLADLREPQRKLLMASYAQGARIKEVAENAGRTPTSLYKMLNRLRVQLQDCIERKLKSGDEGYA